MKSTSCSVRNFQVLDRLGPIITVAQINDNFTSLNQIIEIHKVEVKSIKKMKYMLFDEYGSFCCTHLKIFMSTCFFQLKNWVRERVIYCFNAVAER